MARGNRFRGKDRFILKLRALKPEVRLEIEKATEANARDMVKTSKGFVPVDEGDLRDSIKAEGRRDGPAIRWRVVAGDEKAFYARWVEFGTAPGTRVHKKGPRSGMSVDHPGTSANPYFFVAYRALRKRLKGRLSRALTRAKKKALAK